VNRAQLGIRLALLALILVLVQTAAFSQLQLFGATPDLVPLVVASVGLLAGTTAGATMGFGAGLLIDFALLQTLGISSLVYVMVGHFAGRLRESSRDPSQTGLPLVAGAMATAVAMLAFSTMQFLLGVEAAVSFDLVRQIVSTVLINTLLALPVHAVVRRWLSPALPDRSRRGRRSRPGLSPLIQP
jgi:rod shape-determining protein MreD